MEVGDCGGGKAPLNRGQTYEWITVDGLSERRSEWRRRDGKWLFTLESDYRKRRGREKGEGKGMVGGREI